MDFPLIAAGYFAPFGICLLATEEWTAAVRAAEFSTAHTPSAIDLPGGATLAATTAMEVAGAMASMAVDRSRSLALAAIDPPSASAHATRTHTPAP